jgi:Arc/MetJ-type ribon-helix-helix transcriptional regulator
MKTIEVALTKKLASEVENYVKSGWFDDEKEVMRTALQEFIRRHRIELMEKFQLEDIEWALARKNRNKK